MKKGTQAELEALKAIWLEDPYWAIEDTEGFEAYRDELRQFHHDAHAKQERDKQARLIKFINQYRVEQEDKLEEATEPEETKSEGEAKGGG